MTLLAINKAVIDQLKPHLTGNFSNVKFMAEDLTEPIVRPSIKVTSDDHRYGHYTGANAERSLMIRLYFFATSDTKNKFDNLAMQEIIEATFLNGLNVGNEILFIESIDSTVSDGVLISSFEITDYEELAEDNGSGEPMEELDITLYKG